jgi:hypothetical protein
MKKFIALFAALFFFLAWSGSANAVTYPYYDQTFTSTHTYTDYKGDDISVVIPVQSTLRVDATFTKTKGRCVKDSSPLIRVVTTDGYFLQSGQKEHAFTQPTKDGAYVQGYVTFAMKVAPGTYTITPSWPCGATSSTRVLLY